METTTPIRKLSEVKTIIDTAAAVIFDNDGTLVDTMPLHLIAWQAALNKHGIQFSEAQFYQLAGLPAKDIINLLKEQQNVTGVTVEQVLTTRHQFLKHALNTVKPIQVTLQLLEYAHSKNVPVAVASGGERTDVLASMRSAGIDVNNIGAIVTADDVVNGKPDPETFLTAANRLGVDPTKCVGLEDGDNGLDSLQAAGMTAIDVRLLDGYPLPEYFR